MRRRRSLAGCASLRASRCAKPMASRSSSSGVEKVDAVKQRVVQTLAEEGREADGAGGPLKSVEKDIVRGNILETGQRIDGRDTRTVRPIDSQVSVLPRSHGSALFTRGETQALVVVTLGTGQDEQIIGPRSTATIESTSCCTTNFPPYSVGEASFLRSPGRREIGHGKLAWRAVRPLMPTKEEFPLHHQGWFSEITESKRLVHRWRPCAAARWP